MSVSKHGPIFIGSLGEKSICTTSAYISYLFFIYLMWLSCLAVASCAKSENTISCETSNENFASRIILWHYLQVMCTPQLFISQEISHSKCSFPLVMLPPYRIFGIPKLLFIARFKKCEIKSKIVKKNKTKQEKQWLKITKIFAFWLELLKWGSLQPILNFSCYLWKGFHH